MAKQNAAPEVELEAAPEAKGFVFQELARSAATDPGYAAEKAAERKAQPQVDIDNPNHANKTYEELRNL